MAALTANGIFDSLAPWLLSRPQPRGVSRGLGSDSNMSLTQTLTPQEAYEELRVCFRNFREWWKVILRRKEAQNYCDQYYTILEILVERYQEMINLSNEVHADVKPECDSVIAAAYRYLVSIQEERFADIALPPARAAVAAAPSVISAPALQADLHAPAAETEPALLEQQAAVHPDPVLITEGYSHGHAAVDLQVAAPDHALAAQMSSPATEVAVPVKLLDADGDQPDLTAQVLGPDLVAPAQDPGQPVDPGHADAGDVLPARAAAAEVLDAAPGPDPGLPVDRGPAEAGDTTPAPAALLLLPLAAASDPVVEDIPGSEEGIWRKLDHYADNVTVDKDFEPSMDKIPVIEGSELLLMSNPIVSNLANDALRGTNDAAMLTSALVTYWMVRSNHGHKMVPAACSWIFPTIGIGFLLFSRGASDEAKEDVLTSINDYLLTKTFPVGVRGCGDEVDGNACDLRTQYSSESAAPSQYKLTRRKAVKFAEYLGSGRRKRRKKINPRMNRIQGREKTQRMKGRRRKKKKRFRISLDKSHPNPVRRWQCHNMLPASLARKSSAATIVKFQLLTVHTTFSLKNSELQICARFPSTIVNDFRRCLSRLLSSALCAGTPTTPRPASRPSASSSSTS